MSHTLAEMERVREHILKMMNGWVTREECVSKRTYTRHWQRLEALQAAMEERLLETDQDGERLRRRVEGAWGRFLGRRKKLGLTVR